MATVTLNNLCKTYENSTERAVDNVCLDVAHGEFMVLLGPSGCGKSTTLRMIAGLEAISSGDLLIDERKVNNLPAKDRDIAMVFQSYALYPHMNVRDNLGFGLRRRAIDAAEIARRVDSVALMLGLAPLLGRKPHALSGGQRQRVALGRAIVRDPKVFLFDEPLSNLDASLRVSTRGELIKLHRRLGATMIYVTHDQVEAMTMGNRICIMNRGKVEQIGAPLEVYRRPANTFVAGFLGNPPMNLVPANIAEGHLVLGETRLALPADLLASAGAHATIVFGIRPEDLSLGTGPCSFAAEIVTVEPLGAETIATLRVAGMEAEVNARLGRDVDVRTGDVLSIRPDLARAIFFDATTGKALH
ncbi:MAG: sn-glycerol-3-phosphate ABC transporter ATP-binding protein UgpC [Betaproteobacteria bacterium]